MNFSGNDTIENLKAKITALNADNDVEAKAKALAVLMLDGVKEKSAIINLKCNFCEPLRAQQVEIQITGRKS